MIGAQEVIDMLKREEVLSNNKIMPERKATHGSCCTCQDCGYYHDECICGDNEIIESVIKLFEGRD